MKLTLKLEKTQEADVYRALVFQILEHGYRPVTVVHDIAESDLITLNIWMQRNYPTCRLVRMDDGTDEEPDCITVFEAAEAIMGY